MNEFMKDRYGVDELATLMGGAGVLLALIGTIADLDPLTWLALAIILLALAREARVLRQRVHARRVRDAGQQRAFVGIERAGGFAEITPARTADALVAVAEVDGVHV